MLDISSDVRYINIYYHCMPKTRKSRLKSYTWNSNTGQLEKVEVISTQPSNQRQDSASPKQNKVAKPKQNNVNLKQNNVNLKQNNVNLKQNKVAKPKQVKIAKTKQVKIAKTKQVKIAKTKQVKIANSGRKRKREADDPELESVVSRRTNIWSKFFFDRNESQHLKRLIEKYQKPVKSIERPNKKARKSKNTREKPDNRITQNLQNPIDRVRSETNCTMTRSMVRKMLGEVRAQGDDMDSFLNSTQFTHENNSDHDDDSSEVLENDKNNCVDLGWMSATQTKNYLLGDTCVDWLNRYYSKYGLTESELTPDERIEYEHNLNDASHLEILFEGGNRFEEEVYRELRNIYENDFALVFDQNDYQIFTADRNMNGFIRTKYDETIQLMCQGMPIIAQAVMINDSNMTYGIADLLVRSDFLSELFVHFPIDSTINKGASKIGSTDYHYRVIDCKWTTMTLCVKNPDMLRNDGFFPAYKGQLAVYTTCLRQMQGYVPERAYIMAKAWKIGVENIPNGEEHMYRGFSAFDRPGVIDYAGWDYPYVERTKEAIKWIQKVQTEGREWRYGQDKPSVTELYPNMSKTHNITYSAVKNEIAKRYGEITQGWYVGVNHRNNAFDNGIFDIRDPNISLDILGITSEKRGQVIQQIIDINKNGQNEDLIRPPIIRTNNTNWQSPHVMDYFVDFETITYNLFVKPDYIDIDNSYFDSGVTFMVGIGFVNEPGVDTAKIIQALEIDSDRCGVFHRIDQNNYNGYGHWEFVCFYLTKFKVENELELFRLFFQFMIVRNCVIKDILSIDDTDEADSRIFHWTGAELTFMKNAVRRMKSNQYDTVLANIFHLQSDEDIQDVKRDVKDLIRCFEDTIVWVDLYEEMVKEPVVVKGCYRFKLKHFANAMQKNGLILTNWGSTKMSDGLRAMFEAIRIYREVDDMELSVTGENNANFKEIIDYNEVDCRVMWEIIEYLRTNHTLTLQ